MTLSLRSQWRLHRTQVIDARTSATRRVLEDRGLLSPIPLLRGRVWRRSPSRRPTSNEAMHRYEQRMEALARVMIGVVVLGGCVGLGCLTWWIGPSIMTALSPPAPAGVALLPEGALLPEAQLEVSVVRFTERIMLPILSLAALIAGLRQMLR